MFCRKTLNRHRNQADLAAWDKSSGSLLIGWTVPADKRREPGSGFHAEHGNLALRCKGSDPSGDPARVRVPRRSAGADRFVVAKKPGNSGGAKGSGRPVSDVDQPARGGVLD